MYQLKPPEQHNKPAWTKRIPFFAVGIVILIRIVILLDQSGTINQVLAPSLNAHQPSTQIETGMTGWINGIDSCPTSAEYGQLVAPIINLYSSPEVNALERLGSIPHGSKIEVFYPTNGMDKIRYNNQEGFVQRIFVVYYNPNTETRPPGDNMSGDCR